MSLLLLLLLLESSRDSGGSIQCSSTWRTELEPERAVLLELTRVRQEGGYRPCTSPSVVQP